MQLRWNRRCTVRKKRSLHFTLQSSEPHTWRIKYNKLKESHKIVQVKKSRPKWHNYLLTASVTLFNFSDLKYPNFVCISKKTKKKKNKNWHAENTNWSPIAPQWTCSSRRNRPTISFAWWPWSFFQYSLQIQRRKKGKGLGVQCFWLNAMRMTSTRIKCMGVLRG